MTKPKPKTILVIGDAHVNEHQSLRRFTALSKFIKEQSPDEIVSIGDFMSMDCLSEWDRNKRAKMEGRRYSKEIDAGNEALDHLESCIDYSPKKIYIEGNHEYRLKRYLALDPTFTGTVSIEDDLRLKKRGWKHVDYKDHYYVNGIAFTHVPINASGKPISNPTVAQKALRLYGTSIVFGHTHTLDHAAEHRHGTPHLNQALCVGCFFEHVDEYAVGSKTDYWRGVVMLTAYSPNRFDIDTYSMSRLLKQYA